MLQVKALQNDAELDAALERIGELLRAAEGTPEYEELQTLSDLVVEYEKIHYPSEDPEPADWVQGRLDALGWSEDDLIPCLGSREVVDAVLAGQQKITREMAGDLAQLLGIDADLLLLPAAESVNS